MTAPEAAAYLRLDAGRSMDCALVALDRLVKQRGLPALRYTKDRKYLRRALDEWLERQSD